MDDFYKNNEWLLLFFFFLQAVKVKKNPKKQTFNRDPVWLTRPEKVYGLTLKNGNALIPAVCHLLAMHIFGRSLNCANRGGWFYICVSFQVKGNLTMILRAEEGGVA